MTELRSMRHQMKLSTSGFYSSIRGPNRHHFLSPHKNRPVQSSVLASSIVSFFHSSKLNPTSSTVLLEYRPSPDA